MIYKIEVYIEDAGKLTTRWALENLIEDIIQEALPEEFLVRDVTVEEQ